jgi:hypothetical protein
MARLNQLARRNSKWFHTQQRTQLFRDLEGRFEILEIECKRLVEGDEMKRQLGELMIGSGWSVKDVHGNQIVFEKTSPNAIIAVAYLLLVCSDLVEISRIDYREARGKTFYLRA